MKRADTGRVVPDFVDIGGSTPMELAPVTGAVVPEPAAAGLLMLLLVPLLCRRARRRRYSIP